MCLSSKYLHSLKYTGKKKNTHGSVDNRTSAMEMIWMSGAHALQEGLQILSLLLMPWALPGVTFNHWRVWCKIKQSKHKQQYLSQTSSSENAPKMAESTEGGHKWQSAEQVQELASVLWSPASMSTEGQFHGSPCWAQACGNCVLKLKLSLPETSPQLTGLKKGSWVSPRQET